METPARVGSESDGRDGRSVAGASRRSVGSEVRDAISEDESDVGWKAEPEGAILDASRESVRRGSRRMR